MRDFSFGLLTRKLVDPVRAFFQLESASGLLLLTATLVALATANSPLELWYQRMLSQTVSLSFAARVVHASVTGLINDGLMSLFFFLVGMEIKRELAVGELRTSSKALLPGIAAVGGMVTPAAITSALNLGRSGAAGWAIPMATDIAFCAGCLSLMKSRIPHGLVVFVVALAIFDDIGGILVIALAYGRGVHVLWLLGAAAVVGLLWLYNRARAPSAVVYGLAGIVLWGVILQSGIHPTLSGVVLGLMVPARVARGGEAPLDRFVRWLHPWVAFAIVPIFALANSGLSLTSLSGSMFREPVFLGSCLGLFLGKQIGVFAATVIGVRLGVSGPPGQAHAGQIYGASLVAGIGFTVALFIAELAFVRKPELLAQAKLGILMGSALAGVAGLLVLRVAPPVPAREA